MLALDVAWWWAVSRLAQQRVWRVALGAFMAAQMAGFLAIFAERIWRVQWLHETPKIVFTSIVTWHFFGLAFVIVIGVAAGLLGLFRLLMRAAKHPGPTGEPSNANGESLTRREFFGTSVAVAPAIFSIGLTGVALAQLNQFRVRRFTLNLPALPKQLDGMTIAHVSDIHVGKLTSGRVLKEMVRVTNEMRADVVMLTGDLINDALSDLSEGIFLVKSMESKYGSWMIEGNHDLIENGEEFERRVKAAGIPLLLDESVVVPIRGCPVELYGLRWTRAEGPKRVQAANAAIQKMMQRRQPDAFPILLSHHPHAFDPAAEAKIPLTLSGHTHGGQLMFDSQHGFGPAMFRYWSGLYTTAESQMIVSNGVGNWFPLRVNAPAEIVHITLRSSVRA